MTDEPLSPVITEAAKKAQILWAAVGSSPAACLWCLWIDDAFYVACGPGEQHDPGFPEAATCEVTLRGDHNGRIVDFTATVTRLTGDHADFDEVATALSAKRLNAASGTVDRWRRDGSVYRLAPQLSAVPRTGDQLPGGSLAAVSTPSSAARPTRKPFRLHKVKGKRR